MLVPRRHAVAVFLLSLLASSAALAQTPDLGVCEPVASRVADTWLRGLPWDSAGAHAAAATCGRADAAGGTTARAFIAVMEDRYDDARRELTPLLRSASAPAGARYLDCLLLLEKGRFDAALAACDAALTRRPGWQTPERLRGAALAELGRYAEAAAALRRGLQAVPQSYADWNLLALAERRAGRPQAALSAYEEAYRHVPASLPAWRAAIAINLASWAADSLQQPDRAVEVLADALRSDSTNTRLLQRRADIELKRGRRGEARLHIDRILVLDPRNAAALNSRGLLRAREGDRAGAEADYLAASKDTSIAGAVALMRLSGLHRDAGRKTEAENAMVEFLLRNPDDPDYFRVLPTFVEDSARQLDVYNRVLSRVPSRPARLARLRLPDAVLPPARKLDDATVLAADSTLAGPDKGFVIVTHARLLARLGRLREAVPAFTRLAEYAQELDSTALVQRIRSEALGARALIRTELGDIPGGIADLRAAESAQLAAFKAEGDSALVITEYAPLLRLPGAAVMRDAEASAGRTATAVGLALLQRGELEGLTWLMRGEPDSTSLERFATIVQQRGLSLRDLAARVPARPDDRLSVRFRRVLMSNDFVRDLDSPISAGGSRTTYRTRGYLEQDVPVESIAFAPRTAEAAVRWWHVHAGARYLQRAALRQRNAEIFALAAQRKRTGDGRAVHVAGDLHDPEGERWVQQAYGLTRGTAVYLCSPSTGAVVLLRVGDRRFGTQHGVEVLVRERGESSYTEHNSIRVEPLTGRLVVRRYDSDTGAPKYVLEPSGLPGQGGTLTSKRLGVLRASACRAR